MTEIGNLTVRIDAVITDEQYREAMDAVRAANERMDLLEVENIKLQELAKAVGEFTEGIRCDDCPMARDCEDNNVIACHEKLSYHAFCGMRELGVEVDK